MKALHEGALATLFIVRKTPQDPHTWLQQTVQKCGHPSPKVRGGGQEEPPHVQGAAAEQAQALTNVHAHTHMFSPVSLACPPSCLV